MLNDVAGEGKENLQKEFEEYLSKNKIGKKMIALMEFHSMLVF